MQLIQAQALRSARTCRIRPVRPRDATELQRFIRGLSAESRFARFMMGIRELPDALLHRFVHPQSGRAAALVAQTSAGSIVGLVQYAADATADGGEVALVVADAWQRQGLGTQLLSNITTIAGDHAIAYFHADVLAENQPMRALARKLGWQTNCHPEAAFLIRITKSINSPNQSHAPKTRQ